VAHRQGNENERRAAEKTCGSSSVEVIGDKADVNQLHATFDWADVVVVFVVLLEGCQRGAHRRLKPDRWIAKLLDEKKCGDADCRQIDKAAKRGSHGWLDTGLRGLADFAHAAYHHVY
jgi:hypothetical protein